MDNTETPRGRADGKPARPADAFQSGRCAYRNSNKDVVSMSNITQKGNAKSVTPESTFFKQ